MHNVMAPQKDNSMASTYEQNKCVYTQDLEKKLRRKDTQPPTTTR